MEKSKNGILVHPFWMTRNGGKHLKHYAEILKSNRYKTLYILLPSMNLESRKLLLSLYFENLLIYYLGLTRTMIPSIDRDSFEAGIDELVNKTNGVGYMVRRVIFKFLKATGNDVTKYIYRHDRTLYIYARLIANKDFILENIGDSLLRHLFYGDLWGSRVRNRYIKTLLSIKTRTKIIPLWYGGVDSFEILSYHNMIFDGIDEIDVFGEYSNICVNSVSTFLNTDMDIRTNIIDADSIYYNNENNNDSYYMKNENNKYLAVYNPSSSDGDGNIVYKQKYYGKRSRL